MKKAQIFGEPFIFIFAIIVAAMVLGFGIKIYYDLSQRSDFAQVADVVQRLNEDITTFYNLEEGSSNTFKYSLPNSIDCFCFLEASNSNPGLQGYCNDQDFKKILIAGPSNAVIWKNSGKQPKGNNAANLPYQSIIKSTFATTTLNSGENPLCFDMVKDKHVLKVTLTSQGDKVSITR